MPHAESDMSLTNGDKPSFQTLEHFKKYPAVTDSIDAVKSHPYGAKMFETAEGAYNQFGQPIGGYLKGPLAYVKPYAEKADSLGDKGLDKLDETFPIIKEDTATLIDTARAYAQFPFIMAGKGRDYLYSTWEDKYKQTASRNDQGNGLVILVLAGVGTAITIQVDALEAISGILGPKKDAMIEKKDSMVDGAKKKKDSYAKKAKNAADDASAKVQEQTS